MEKLIAIRTFIRGADKVRKGDEYEVANIHQAREDERRGLGRPIGTAAPENKMNPPPANKMQPPTVVDGKQGNVQAGAAPTSSASPPAPASPKTTSKEYVRGVERVTSPEVARAREPVKSGKTIKKEDKKRGK